MAMFIRSEEPMQTCWRRILKTRSIKSSTLGQCTESILSSSSSRPLKESFLRSKKKRRRYHCCLQHNGPRKLHHLERGFSNPENDELQIRCRVHDGTIATLHPETARQLVIQQLHRGLFWPHKTRAAKREHLPPFNQGPSNLSNEKKKLVV